MERIGRGNGVAALLNGRAKRVNAKVVRELERALPEAMIRVSADFEQARRHVRDILAAKPLVVLSGGGDGAIVRLLNLLREEGHGAPLPRIGVLKLGTGNGWARTTGANDFFKMLRDLPKMPRELPTERFDLVEVEGQLCHFAGVGWDAKILNDYLRNLDKRSSQLIGSSIARRIHKGIPGYLYSAARITVPEELSAQRTMGRAQVVLENRGEQVFTMGTNEQLLDVTAHAGALYAGPISVGAASSTPEWGFNFRAFPHARAKAGFINVRIYDRPALEGLRSIVQIWKGKTPPGMHDFFGKHLSMKFSRPMPFQIGGDGVGMREQVDFRAAKETVDLIDWRAALAAAQSK